MSIFRAEDNIEENKKTNFAWSCRFKQGRQFISIVGAYVALVIMRLYPLFYKYAPLFTANIAIGLFYINGSKRGNSINFPVM